MAEVSMMCGGAINVGRETKYDVDDDQDFCDVDDDQDFCDVDDVYDEEEDVWLKKRTKAWHDITPEYFPISAPRYDFEEPVPKFGEECRYQSGNLEYDTHNNPVFRWPRKNCVRIHDFIPVRELLFTRRRNFLINNSGDKFDAAHLDGKMLVILILSLDPKDEEQEKTEHFTGVLKEAYTELCSRRDIGFEVVFVAVDDAPRGVGRRARQQFDALFKDMPWLAIPWWDKNARKYCEDKLYDPTVYGPVTCFIVQTNGFIVQDWAAIFTIYGAKAFPFTDQRLEELENQNLRFFRDPSLKELLGDSVISPQGDPVPTAHLENKVVGLLFHLNYIINLKLLSAWEETLKARHADDFEIVVVHQPYSKGSSEHWERSFRWSYLSDTSLCQKLWWIYHPRGNLYDENYPGVLVIIGPQKNRFFNYYGADILYTFGAKGYPFSLERAAELEKEKLMHLELRSLLLGNEDLDSVAFGCKVNVSELLGEEVILFVSSSSWHKDLRQEMLKKLNVDLKRCEGFLSGDIPPSTRIINGDWVSKSPRIYISDEGTTSDDYSPFDLLCSSRSAYFSCVDSGIIGFGDPPQIAVFGRDGRLAAKLCWEDVGGGKRREVFTRICDMSITLFSHLVDDKYNFMVLVGWCFLKYYRRMMEVDYI